MHNSHVWGIRSNNPSKEERMEAAVERLMKFFRMNYGRNADKCYDKVVELSRRGLF